MPPGGRRARRLPERLQRLETAGGEERGHAEEEGELAWPTGRVRPRARATRMVAPEREVPGNTAAKSCAAPTASATAHVTSLRAGAARSAHSTRMMAAPPRSVAHATGATSRGRVTPTLLEDEAPRRGERERGRELEHEAPRPPARDADGQVAQAPAEGHQHRHRGARLYRDVEEIGLAGKPAGSLDEEEMPGGGDGEELGDALDEAEADDRQPLGHAVATRRSALRRRRPRSRCR